MIYFYIGKYGDHNITFHPWTRIYKTGRETYWDSPRGLPFTASGFIIPDELITSVPDEMEKEPIEVIKMYVNL